MTTALRTVILAVLMPLLAACAATPLSRTPVPDALAQVASVDAGQTVRFWGDEPLPAAIVADLEQARLNYASARSGPARYLTLSGGGHNGAFGAGFLLGWTASGTRPTFDVVTGISVGAMIAPMAFLGPHYDNRLQAVFAQLAVDRDRGPGFLGAIFGAPAIESNLPLKRAIAMLIDAQTLTAIADEHRKGRRLFVGTTNLDAERPVIWDIGAIAASNLPNRLVLVRDIILASAAIPGVFPPVLVNVQAAGHAFDEMHVDGGVTQNVLLFSGTFDVLAGGQNRMSGAELYVIYNGQVAPSRESIGVSTVDVVRRAVPTLLKYQGRADLTMLASAARANNVAFRITAISPEFPDTLEIFPSPEWLNALFEYGYESGRTRQWTDRF